MYGCQAGPIHSNAVRQAQCCSAVKVSCKFAHLLHGSCVPAERELQAGGPIKVFCLLSHFCRQAASMKSMHEWLLIEMHPLQCCKAATKLQYSQGTCAFATLRLPACRERSVDRRTRNILLGTGICLQAGSFNKQIHV